jgi:hypothetical protein
MRRRVRLARRMTDADFRPNTTLLECSTGAFTLRWGCTCAGCLRKIHKGDRAHYVDNLICHIGCRPAPRFRAETKPKTPPVFTQTGKREPLLCRQCFTIHAGECL